MGGLSLTHRAIVLIAAMLLFGGGRVARSLGELGRGFGQLRRGLADDAAPLARE